MTNRRRQVATSHLEWVLDGLDAATMRWGGDAAERMSPSFAAALAPEQFVNLTRASAQGFTPLAVTSVLVTGRSATATLSTSIGNVVVTITTDDEEPHLLSSCAMAPLIVPGLAPRLPGTFGPEHFPTHLAPGSRLTVFAGLPGTGKSTLADRLGRETRTPVFAADWLLGALTPFGGRHWDNLLDIAAEQLTHLAFRQLLLGQSAIVDHPAEDTALRERWASMAKSAGATFSVILCQCEDAALHEARFSTRTRGIPGWHETGNWAIVAQRRAAFTPWTGADVLAVDASTPIDDLMQSVRNFVAVERMAEHPHPDEQGPFRQPDGQ